jgi:hypothetical protein
MLQKLLTDTYGQINVKYLITPLMYQVFQFSSYLTGKGTMLQAGRLWVRFPLRSLDSSINVHIPAALWPRGRPRIFLRQTTAGA